MTYGELIDCFKEDLGDFEDVLHERIGTLDDDVDPDAVTAELAAFFVKRMQERLA